MHTTIQALFAGLWSDYTKITPSAQQIHQLLSSTDTDIVNDHIALRTVITTLKPKS